MWEEMGGGGSLQRPLNLTSQRKSNLNLADFKVMRLSVLIFEGLMIFLNVNTTSPALGNSLPPVVSCDNSGCF